jgi:hypothetical protein
MPFSPEVVGRLRSKMDSGAIPIELRPKMFAGRGNGRICTGCDEPISPEQVEYEMDFGGDRIFRLHLACAGWWEAECQRRGHR